jgi:hypothetical protein
MGLRACAIVAAALLAGALGSNAAEPAAGEAATPPRLATILYMLDGAPSRVADMARSLQALDLNFNDRFHYPVTVLVPAARTLPDGSVVGSGDSHLVTPEQERALREGTRSRLTFAPVDFESYADAALLASTPEVVVGRFGKGYRHMCNFFAGPVADHPALAKYRYFWRFDTDSYLVEPVLYDVFAEMARRSWRYGHGHADCDWHVVTEGLYQVAQGVYGARELDARVPPTFADRSCLRGFSPAEQAHGWNNRIFYNNFEVVDLQWMRSDAYQSLYRAAAAAGGIFNQRWGDAPIRTLAVFGTLPPAAVHHFRDVSYYHQALYGPVVVHLIVCGTLAAAGLAVGGVWWWQRRRARAAGLAASKDHALGVSTHPATVALLSAVDAACCCQVGRTLRAVTFSHASDAARARPTPYTLCCCCCRPGGAGGGGGGVGAANGRRGRGLLSLCHRAWAWVMALPTEGEGVEGVAVVAVADSGASGEARSGAQHPVVSTSIAGGEAGVRRRDVAGGTWAGRDTASPHSAVAVTPLAGAGGSSSSLSQLHVAAPPPPPQLMGEGNGGGLDFTSPLARGGAAGGDGSGGGGADGTPGGGTGGAAAGLGGGTSGGVHHRGHAASDADAAGTPSKPVLHAGDTAALSRVVGHMANLQLLRLALVATVVAAVLWLTSRDRLNGTIFPAGAHSVRATTGCYPDELGCLLAARADGRKRVIVTAATEGMLDFIRNLLYSLHRLRVDNYLIFALDERAADYLSHHHVPIYWDPAPIAAMAAGGGGAAGLAMGLQTSGGETTTTALKFGSDAYRAVTMRKNELIYECLRQGYNTVFTDADTVWLINPLDEAANGPEITDPAAWPGVPRAELSPADLRRYRFTEAKAANPYLSHRCAELRLGDTVSAWGDDAPITARSDCGPGGANGLYPYDVKGMYGDVGGMDTGYWYIRPTAASLAHMQAVMAFQRTPAGLAMPSDQETFNEMLKPWLPEHVGAAGVDPALRDIDSMRGFGPSRMRVAMFHPFEAPTGCRLQPAERSGVPILLVHANCRTGWWGKVPWMWTHGVWFVRLWGDTVPLRLFSGALAACLLRWLAVVGLAAWRKPLGAWAAAARRA